MDHSAIQKRLAETEEQIALGQRQVVQQQGLIVKLEAGGRSAAHAKYLLAGLELLQAARRDGRDKLLKRLEKGEVSVLAIGCERNEEGVRSDIIQRNRHPLAK